MHSAEPQALVALQREFFQILAEYFSKVTGGNINRFKTELELTDWTRANARKLVPQFSSAIEWVHPTLAEFYGAHGKRLFQGAREIPGIKIVLGGQSRFFSSQLSSVKQMLL